MAQSEASAKDAKAKLGEDKKRAQLVTDMLVNLQKLWTRLASTVKDALNGLAKVLGRELFL